MRIYSFAELGVKELSVAWVKCVKSWFIRTVWELGAVVSLMVSKLLSPTCFIFFIFAPCPNDAFDSFVFLQLSFFSFVPVSFAKQHWTIRESLFHPAQLLSDFALQLILLFFPAVSCIWGLMFLPMSLKEWSYHNLFTDLIRYVWIIDCLVSVNISTITNAMAKIALTF